MLIGNGFSIGVSQAFRYTSLLQVAQERGLLTDGEVALFSNFNTADFEGVLKCLQTAAQVNETLGVDDRGRPLSSYRRMRDGLLGAVQHVHPAYGTLNLAWMQSVRSVLLEYSNVFTTNYNLLLYWILGSAGNFDGFADFFWSGENEFRPERLPDQARMIHYLHGALLLFRRGHVVHKQGPTGANLLSTVGTRIDAGNIPVFVSEGSSDAKLEAIRNDPYLSHCYRGLRSTRDGITVYGLGLSTQDSHIAVALNDNTALKVIACSIHLTGGPGDQELVISETGRLFALFAAFVVRGGLLQVFDGRTCALSYVEVAAASG